MVKRTNTGKGSTVVNQPKPLNIDEHIRKRRAQFKLLKQSIPTLTKQLVQLKIDASNMVSRATIRKKKELEKKIQGLEIYIKSIENDEESKKFEQKILPFTQAQQWYQQTKNQHDPRNKSSVSILTNQKRAELINEFMTEIEGEPPLIHLNIASDSCEICGVQMILSLNGSVIKCPICNNAHSYLDATSASVAYNEEVEFGSFTYKKINHFQEWLNKFQYKESTQVHDEIIAQVMDYFFIRGVDVKKIDQAEVRKALKHYGLNKQYDHAAQIHCRITGVPPMRMTPEQEEKCRLMFQAIQEPFIKWKPKIMPKRRNFLSYSYCLFKFCQLLGYTNFLKCFALLKGKDKLNKQDALFEAICKELDWEFISSTVDTPAIQKIKLLQKQHQ